MRRRPLYPVAVTTRGRNWKRAPSTLELDLPAADGRTDGEAFGVCLSTEILDPSNEPASLSLHGDGGGRCAVVKLVCPRFLLSKNGALVLF